jgi:hypothetical protein
MIERFRAYGVLRPSVERTLRVAVSVGEVMRLIDAHFLPQGAAADPG